VKVTKAKYRPSGIEPSRAAGGSLDGHFNLDMKQILILLGGSVTADPNTVRTNFPDHEGKHHITDSNGESR
jgi:hypothetical protein